MFQEKNDQEKLNEMKEDYETYPVPAEALDRIKEGIRQADRPSRQQGKRHRRNTVIRTAGLIAAAMAIFIILANSNANIAMAMEKIPLIGSIAKIVTFRNYQYEDERHQADIEVPEIVVENLPGQSLDVPQGSDSESQNAQKPDGTGQNTSQKSSEELQDTLQKSAAEINKEIQEISDSFIKEFEKNLANEWGYQDIVVKSEVMNTSDQYFTLKLICYQGAGSGTEWNYFYTLDLSTGKQLKLSDLFVDGADYITPISENIKEQMRQEMAEDDSKYYWLDDEIEEWNFQQITEETQFYLNENNNIVISFDEGDVAPMYMGVVTFEIPEEAVKDIRK